MRAFSILTIGVSLLSWLVPGTATSQVVVTRMGDTLEDAASYLDNLVPPGECSFGNFGPPASTTISIPFPGQPHYAIGVRPHAECTQCALGFQLHTIHLLGEWRLAAAFQVTVELMDSVNPSGCPEPPPDENEVDCSHDLAAATITSPGFYDVAIPIDCGCAYNDYAYMLAFWPLGYGDLLLDDAAAACHDWANIGFGLGWFDPSFPGDILIYAEADCCEQPIPVESTTWGRVKALFGRS